MSDYMFMLESHLSGDQNRVVDAVQTAAALANVNVFLAGGAMRDMLGGFQVRDLDFRVEGNALKLAKDIAGKQGTRLVSLDENRRSAELLFPGGVTAEIAMSRQEKYSKPAGRAHVTSTTIQDDLRGRDFSVNAMALSLNPASRGLLLDPTNGLADLERHELRALSSHTFFDDPSRLLRLVRFRVRLGFSATERTQRQYDNARQAEMEKHIPPRELLEELKHIAAEPNAGEIVSALEREGLLLIFSPALTGTKLNLASLGKLEKIRHLLPAANSTGTDLFGPFLYVLTEKLTPKERGVLVKNTEMRRAEAGLWKKLEARSKKLEHALRAARVRKPSQIYQILSKASGDEIAFLLYRSSYKPVQERIRNYLQKYIPIVQEISEVDLRAIDAKPGSPKFLKAKAELLAKRLDHPPRKVELPPPVEPVEIAVRGRGR